MTTTRSKNSENRSRTVRKDSLLMATIVLRPTSKGLQGGTCVTRIRHRLRHIRDTHKEKG